MWSFPGFACPLVLYIPCAFSALAARLLCVRAVLSLFPVSCSLHSFPFFPQLQSFQFLPSAVGNCFSFVISYFLYCFLVIFSLLLFYLMICFPVQQTTNRIGNRVQCFFCFLFVNMVGDRSVNVMNTTTTTTTYLESNTVGISRLSTPGYLDTPCSLHCSPQVTPSLMIWLIACALEEVLRVQNPLYFGLCASSAYSCMQIYVSHVI